MTVLFAVNYINQILSSYANVACSVERLCASDNESQFLKLNISSVSLYYR